MDWDAFSQMLGRSWNGTSSLQYQPMNVDPMVVGRMGMPAPAGPAMSSGQLNLTPQAPANMDMGALGNGWNAPALPANSGGIKGWLSDGRNLGTAIQGFGTLAQAYIGFKQLKAAKDQLNFQKGAFAQNMTNQTQSYNTALEDKIRGRTSNYEGKENDVSSYLAKHSLKYKP